MSRDKVGIALIAIIILLFALSTTPMGIAMINTWHFNQQKADDATNYKTLKEVEDTARIMIASYQTDSTFYNQFKDSDIQEEQNWATMAKMRANKTAIKYNEYILKNSFVWKNNIPNYIDYKLEIIGDGK